MAAKVTVRGISYDFVRVSSLDIETLSFVHRWESDGVGGTDSVGDGAECEIDRLGDVLWEVDCD